MSLLRVAEIKLSLNELEILTGMNARVLKSKLHSIAPERGGQNSTLYPLKEAIDAIYKIDQNDLAALKLQREKAEARLAEAKAIKVEMENAATEKSLIPLAEAEKTFGDLVVNFKTRLEALPSKATFMIKNMSDPGQVESYLSDLVHEVLDELSRAKVTGTCETSSETHH